MRKQRAFISHVSSETEIAQSLKQHLAVAFPGLLDIFVSSDTETIQAGARWLDEVENALKSADFQIILCSRESVGRPWVNFEAGAVWLRGVPVIPVCHSGLRSSDLPVPLALLEGIEFSKADDLQKLYETIARKLDVKRPDLDFVTLAAELSEVEKKYGEATADLETVEGPNVLCAASTEYASYGFESDLSILQGLFNKSRVTVEGNLTQKRLRDLLTNARYDIVHLVLAVDPDNGDLIFSPIHDPANKATPPDRMSAAGFSSLLVESKTSLVVLATCEALLLAVEVATTANMAAGARELYIEQFVEWADCFYSLLADGKPLFKAFDITRSQCDAPIRAIRHKNVVYRPAQ